MDLQDGLVVFVRNEEFRGEGVPLLDHVAHRVTRGSLDLQLRRGFSRVSVYPHKNATLRVLHLMEV